MVNCSKQRFLTLIPVFLFKSLFLLGEASHLTGRTDVHRSEAIIAPDLLRDDAANFLVHMDQFLGEEVGGTS